MNASPPPHNHSPNPSPANPPAPPPPPPQQQQQAPSQPQQTRVLRFLDFETKAQCGNLTQVLSLLHTQLYNEPHIGLSRTFANVHKNLGRSQSQTWTDLIDVYDRATFNHSLPNTEPHTETEPVLPHLTEAQRLSPQWINWDGLNHDIHVFAQEIHSANNELTALVSKCSTLFANMNTPPPHQHNSSPPHQNTQHTTTTPNQPTTTTPSATEHQHSPHTTTNLASTHTSHHEQPGSHHNTPPQQVTPPQQEPGQPAAPVPQSQVPKKKKKKRKDKSLKPKKF